jgi:hypothetical protein
MVESTNGEATSEEAERCEDCGRRIEVGEPHTVYTATEGSTDYVFAAQHPALIKHAHGPGQSSKWINDSAHYIVIDEDDVLVWEALGFFCDETEVYGQTEYHVSCQHCAVAARWLTKICGQHTVLVTQEDLIEHTHEYDGKTLGLAFMRLAALARRQWRFPVTERLAAPAYISALTDVAIKRAIAAGLQEAA